MIYIATLIVCLFLIWKFDWRGETKHKELWYYGLMVWFIAISALQYYVGTDIDEYIIKHQSFHGNLSFNMLLGGAEERRQAGWILLTWFCKLFTEDFILVKIIQAVFLNVAVFTFFKRESKYIFLCIFFYAVADYLVINFNTLRQSFSIAFGLFAVIYLKDEKYLKYGLFTLLAFMFHNSAIILLALLIIKFFKPNKLSIGIALAASAIVIFFLFRMNMESVAFNFVLSGMIDENTSDIAMTYLMNDRLGIQEGTKMTIHALIVMVVVGYYTITRRDFFWGGFGAAYVFMLILTTMMPILWRFRLYFDLPYYVMLSKLVVEFPLKQFRQIKYFVYIVAIAIFMYFPMKDYLHRAPGNKYRYIDQYYPYHSIFDPKLEKRF